VRQGGRRIIECDKIWRYNESAHLERGPSRATDIFFLRKKKCTKRAKCIKCTHPSPQNTDIRVCNVMDHGLLNGPSFSGPAFLSPAFPVLIFHPSFSGPASAALWSLSVLHSPVSVTPYHGLRGSASPVLTATGFVNGIWQFSTPHRINTPWPITKKFGTGDYVGGPYGCAKFGANQSMGGFWANGWNITKLFLFIPFIMNSPTGKTRRRIFTLDGSNNAGTLMQNVSLNRSDHWKIRI